MRQPLDGLPRRILDIEVNGICEIADMGRDDPEVIKLWIGEGDLPTASFVTEAAIAALREGHTRYSYALGLPRLRRALADYHKRHWGVDIPHDRFSVTVGGMNAIMQAMQAVLEPGDEVLHPSPAWPNLAEVVRINNGAPVPVPFDRDGGGRPHLDLDTLFAAVTPRTRVIAINSPSNPTGWIMPKADMARLVAFARERGLWILSDEVYNHFTYGNAIAPSFLELTTPDDRLIVTNTFSKNWAMTGWRAGWLVYPRGMDAVFDNLSQYNTTSIPTFIQHAAVAALDEGDGFIRQMVGRCAESRRIFLDGLSALPGVRVSVPDGAFYMLFALDAEPDARAAAVRLLKEARVGVAPGTAFGPDGAGWMRLCFAVSPDLARDAVARLTRLLQ